MTKQPYTPRVLFVQWGRERQPGDLVFSMFMAGVVLCLIVAFPWQTVWHSDQHFLSQPAFWPGLGIGLMGLAGLGNLYNCLRSARQPGRRQALWQWLRTIEFAAWFVGYVVIVPIIGYLLATIIFMLALMGRTGFRAPRELGMALVGAIVIVIVFRGFLSVNIPSGAVYDWLPEGSIRLFFQLYL
ncbi:MAG: tripartite tricarboxylate transporter TctB family protein [Alphaproteobacteria bacterium]|nr:tripartite tricarboxylate transporter TctB family protein [Alphaproteobacteria bacterium]